MKDYSYDILKISDALESFSDDVSLLDDIRGNIDELNTTMEGIAESLDDLAKHFLSLNDSTK